MGLRLIGQINWRPTHWTAVITLKILSNHCTCCSLLPQLQPPPPVLPPPPQPHMVDTLKSIPTVGMNQPMRELVWCAWQTGTSGLHCMYSTPILHRHGPHCWHVVMWSIPRSTVNCRCTYNVSTRKVSFRCKTVLYLTKTFVVKTLNNYNLLLCYVHEMPNITTAF